MRTAERHKKDALMFLTTESRRQTIIYRYPSNVSVTVPQEMVGHVGLGLVWVHGLESSGL